MTYIGVTIDCKLSFSEHLELTANKASSTLGFVFRNVKEFKDPYVLKNLYISLVRPILEYASVIWFPYFIKHSNILENIQKRFIRLALRYLGWADPICLPPYHARLALLNMRSLDHRRKVTSALFIFDLLSNGIDALELSKRVNINEQVAGLRFRRFVYEPMPKSLFSAKEPLNRSIRYFNIAYSAYIKDHTHFLLGTNRQNFKRCAEAIFPN